jgi:DNA-binding response OmpR family regulator
MASRKAELTVAAKILIVEDDPSLGENISRFLSGEGYEVQVAESLKEARKALSGTAPALLILDWMLPDGQGIDFLREYRAGGGALPVILLTARTELVDKVLGLETGANDYLTKPFEPRELVARIRVQLRAPAAAGVAPARPAEITAGPIRINPGTREVSVSGRGIELSKMEYALLQLLCENPGKVFSREELLNKVWGFESYPTTRTVDTHILQLRQKVGEEYFETVRGIGYRLKAEKK